MMSLQLRMPLVWLSPRHHSPGARRELAFWTIAVGIFLVAALLRLVWVQDIEYKADEAIMYETVCAVRAGAPWPALGFPSSQNAPAHGMMIWVFLTVDHIYPAADPPELARVCQCLNLLAMVGLLVFIRTSVPEGSRVAWLWAAALLAVNPIAVVLQRKIWPISITPPFLLLVLIGFWYRDRRWGAALWGSVVLIVGMIHVGGLFLAVALAGWALAFDRARVRWGWWLAGSLAVGWGLIPWIYAVLTTPTQSTGQIRLSNPLTLSYWLRWITEPFGISIHYSLGKDFADFLRYPLVGGQPTYLMGAAHVGLAIVAIAILLGGTVRAWVNWRGIAASPSPDDTRTRHVVGAVWVGLGLVFTFSFLPIHRHYMILTFPVMYLWAAIVALSDRRMLVWGWTRGQALLLATWLLQAAVSVCFLVYVHDAGRLIRGDYGTPYAAQIANGSLFK